MKTHRLLVTALLFCLSATIAGAQSREITQLGTWLEGNYSNQAQAVADASYPNIRLHIKRIWKQRADGIWFYVEQATKDAPGKPERQYFYHIMERADGQFNGEIYTVAAPQRFAGAWKNPQLLRSIVVDSLQLRNGCTQVMGFYDDMYSGLTDGKGCTGDLPNAAYTTISFTLTKAMLELHERCYDSEGRQVAGTARPYELKRE